MARERMVTRSINVATYDVMTVSMDTMQVVTLNMDIPSWNTMSDKKIKDYLESCLPRTNKYVQHTLISTREVLYGIPEADFIKTAKVLPPRTKVDESEE